MLTVLEWSGGCGSPKKGKFEEGKKSFWKKKTQARRYFRYHLNHKIARMRSLPVRYPNVELNTTERWFENFHFCNLLSFVKPRLERNLAAVSKVWHDFPSDALGWWGCGRDRTREEREGRRWIEKCPPGAAEGAGRSLSVRGFGSTYRKPKALEADPSAATETRGVGDLGNCWRIFQPVGKGCKELAVRSREVGISITRSTAAYQIQHRGSYLEEKRLLASSCNL